MRCWLRAVNEYDVRVNNLEQAMHKAELNGVELVQEINLSKEEPK